MKRESVLSVREESSERREGPSRPPRLRVRSGVRAGLRGISADDDWEARK